MAGARTADVDEDGMVGLSDLALLLSELGRSCDPAPCDSNSDLDGDADVDLSDLAILLSRFGATCG